MPSIRSTQASSLSTRTLSLDRPVQVYHNSVKKCWSVRQGGLVVLRTNAILLSRASMVVYENGRKESLKVGHKTLHAWITGYVDSKRLGGDGRFGITGDDPNDEFRKEIFYDKDSGSFRSRCNGEIFTHASAIFLGRTVTIER